jgi:hypothetical protein
MIRVHRTGTKLPLATTLFCLLALGLVACGPRGIVSLGDLDGCLPDLPGAGEQVVLGASSTEDLACMLAVFRDAHLTITHPQALQASRVACELATRESNPDRVEKLANEGVWWAKKAADGSIRGEARYYEALNLGMVIRHRTFLAARKLGSLEAALKEALALVPSIDHGGPMRVLGLLYVKAPAWPQGIGDADKGLELLAKAVERHPEHPLNLLFHAQALWDIEEDDALATVKRELTMAFQRLEDPRWGYTAPHWRKEVESLAREVGMDVPDSTNASSVE